ncbi:MAG: arginine N-succinyltransferase [Thermodesulfobacteriota bacterium]|nr:arginine N-succinyltransferase [Thermodesulfobacteriota bacterium]
MNQQPANTKGFSGKQVVAIVVGVMLLTIVVTIVSIRTWLFPQPFTPVVLDQKEEQHLEQKLVRFESFAAVPKPEEQASIPGKTTTPKKDFNKQGELNPEAYSEKGASREISLSEREINGLLAKNTDLAQKIAVDLAKDLISLRLLLPVDPDFPVMGGKTIRAKAGAELAYREGRPVVVLKGISLMGVPVPNAWLGGIKNIDLVQEFGGNQGVWKSFADGMETIRVEEGQLYIKLKE